MTISVEDLLTPQTPAQTRTTLVNALVTLGVPADQWNPGGAFSVILTVIATVYANLTVLLAQAIGSGFLPTATGGWLTLLAIYVYGVTRPAATFASGAITLTNGGGGTFTYVVGAVTFFGHDQRPERLPKHRSDRARPELDANRREIKCTAAGAIGSAAPGEINALVTQMPAVTVSNGLSVVGQDAMGDDDLRTLCTNSLGASSVRGPRSAYAYAISVAVNAVTGAASQHQPAEHLAEFAHGDGGDRCRVAIWSAGRE